MKGFDNILTGHFRDLEWLGLFYQKAFQKVKATFLNSTIELFEDDGRISFIKKNLRQPQPLTFLSRSRILFDSDEIFNFRDQSTFYFLTNFPFFKINPNIFTTYFYIFRN